MRNLTAEMRSYCNKNLDDDLFVDIRYDTDWRLRDLIDQKLHDLIKTRLNRLNWQVRWQLEKSSDHA